MNIIILLKTSHYSITLRHALFYFYDASNKVDWWFFADPVAHPKRIIV